MLPFNKTRLGSHARHRHSNNRTIPACNLNGAFIAFKAPAVADLESKRPIACGGLASFYALSAAVATGFIDNVLVIIVVRVVLIDFPDHPPLKGVLRTNLSRGNTLLIRLAGDIKVSGTEHAVTALVEIVHRFYSRMAQNTGSAAQVTRSAFGRIHLKDCIPGSSLRKQAGSPGNADNS